MSRNLSNCLCVLRLEMVVASSGSTTICSSILGILMESTSWEMDEKDCWRFVTTDSSWGVRALSCEIVSPAAKSWLRLAEPVEMESNISTWWWWLYTNECLVPCSLPISWTNEPCAQWNSKPTYLTKETQLSSSSHSMWIWLSDLRSRQQA